MKSLCRAKPKNQKKNGNNNLLSGSLLAIPQRIDSCCVSIERNNAEIPDGRGTVENIETDPDVTKRSAEDPVPQTLVDGRQGQDGDREQEVREGEVADQVVRDRS